MIDLQVHFSDEFTAINSNYSYGQDRLDALIAARAVILDRMVTVGAFPSYPQNMRRYEVLTSYRDLLTESITEIQAAITAINVMPDIVNIPVGYGGPAYTFSLEQMVHYKLNQYIPNLTEQHDSNTWRLVRHLPIGSTTWHPTNDNLVGDNFTYGGDSWYGTQDNTSAKWGLPFDQHRHGPSYTGYFAWDEMFIASGDYSQWVHFPRSSIMGVYSDEPQTVYATNYNQTQHTLRWYNRGASAPQDPHISTKDYGDDYETNMVYTEFNGTDSQYNTWATPGKGSLVFVRRRPLEMVGGDSPSQI